MKKCKQLLAMAVAVMSVMSLGACGNSDSSAVSSNAGVALDSEELSSLKALLRTLTGATPSLQTPR